MIWRRVFIGFATMFFVGSVAVHAKDRPDVQWVWSGSREAGAKLQLEKEFATNSKIAAARLRLAADFCDAEVLINGVQVHAATPMDSAVVIDAQRFCKQGANRISLHAISRGGPAAIAFELTVTESDNQAKTYHTNPTWRSMQKSSVKSYGHANSEPWWRVESLPKTDAFDEYNQWKEAVGPNTNVEFGSFQVPKGFNLERIYQTDESDGSWISMTVDDRGRLIVGKESAGIMRLTLDSSFNLLKKETINDNLKSCHGLLWSKGSLFANASNSKALYRLEDSNGDDQFDDVRLLKNIPGGGGDHGRNDLVEGHDGSLYLIHGDAVQIPEGSHSRVPLTREFLPAGRPKAGHLVRTDRTGRVWEIVASGLRNPYGVDINSDGELFTYDADSERHVGLPWYRPTRMNHLVSGTDYGWRRGDDLPWPIDRPESMRPNVLIGRGSPTVVKFGTRSNFPSHYRKAMFAADWSFGRLFAVHVVPRGASYSMHPELFLSGRPFNVVDLEFAQDGSMFILTGGYGTRSSLYRLSYVGSRTKPNQETPQQVSRAKYAKKLRELRQRIESFHRPHPHAVAFCWNFLAHPDRWIRNAARIAIEHQPVASWRSKLMAEARPEFALPALLAKVRMEETADHTATLDSLLAFDFSKLDSEQLSIATRIANLISNDLDDSGLSQKIANAFELLFPVGESSIDREICSLLVRHGSEQVAARTLDLLAAESRQESVLHYLLELTNSKNGWNRERYEAFFRLIQGARLFQGDEQLPRIVEDLTNSALAIVPENERDRYAQLLTAVSTEREEAIIHRDFVRTWSVSDFAASIGNEASKTKGQQVFRQALCSRCHRLGTVGRSFGPDLTGLPSRYSRQEVVEAILRPSDKVSSRYQNQVITTRDGKIITGQIVWNGFRKSIIRIATDPMRMEDVVEISKDQIESHQPSPLSPMPSKLLDTFDRGEIESLLRFLGYD